MTPCTSAVARSTARGDGAPRPGFTLIEMMLVLALMVAIGAIVWPALDKPFAAERLRASGDELRAELARGRVAAMQSGRAHVFSVDGVTGRYFVHPADEPAVGVSTPTAASSSSTAPMVPIGRALPEGIKLQELLAFDDVTPLPPTAQPQQSTAPAGTAAPLGTGSAALSAGPTSAPQPVYFHPDGTTSSARFTLANEHGVTLVLELRGLTGATRAGEPLAAGAVR